MTNNKQKKPVYRVKSRRGQPYEITKDFLKVEIERCYGNVTQIARANSIARATIYKYIEEYNLNQDLADARQVIVDIAEFKLIGMLENELIEPSVRAGVAKYILSTLGKDKGWTQKQLIDSKVDSNVTHEISDAFADVIDTIHNKDDG